MIMSQNSYSIYILKSAVKLAKTYLNLVLIFIISFVGIMVSII